MEKKIKVISTKKKNRKKKKKKNIFGTFRYNNSHCPFSLEANYRTHEEGERERKKFKEGNGETERERQRKKYKENKEGDERRPKIYFFYYVRTYIDSEIIFIFSFITYLPLGTYDKLRIKIK